VDSRKILIVGALGLVGRAAVEHFTAQDDCEVIGIARRRPDFETTARFISVDLRDAEACRGHAADFAGVTNIVYAALYEKASLVAGWRDPEQIAINLAMLRNIVEPVEAASPDLRHVTLLQGTKAYGSHVEPMRIPAKERWPRHNHENFYWAQEDWLSARAEGKSWSWSILRPQAVLGHAVGSPMNVIIAIGAYAAILRERGEPLHWPGGRNGFLTMATDAALLASAIDWVGTEPQCARETFNINNGDVLSWPDIWPAVAELFGMETGETRVEKLADSMPGQEAVWAEIVRKHGLVPTTLEQLVGASWQFADYSFRTGEERPAPTMLSGIKAREFGFADCIDTEDCIVEWLERLQVAKLLPL